MTETTHKTQPSASQGSISAALNANRILPNECPEAYQASLAALIQELGANTPLKRYLAENIHECLIWIRRQRLQKQAYLSKQIEDRIDSVCEEARRKMSNREDEVSDDRDVLLAYHGTSAERIGIAITKDSQYYQDKLDSSIALQQKMLLGFLAEYERLEFRPLRRQYLQLQIDKMRREVGVTGHEDLA